MKQKLKNTKGITLVALIITIIVLLILAVVAITSISNSNIIKHAQNGKEAYEQGKTNEATTLAEYENYLNENSPIKKNSNIFEGSFYNFKNGINVIKFNDGKITAYAYNRNGTIENTYEDGVYKVKDNIITAYEDETYNEENSMTYLIKDRTIDGKTYKSITIPDEDKDNENDDVCWFETMPPVRTDLLEKKYGYKENENNENLKYTFTVKIYNINGQQIMSFYDENYDEDYNFVIFDGNKIYEFPDGCLKLYGNINDDGTIDQNDSENAKGYTRYYVIENN